MFISGSTAEIIGGQMQPAAADGNNLIYWNPCASTRTVLPPPCQQGEHAYPNQSGCGGFGNECDLDIIEIHIHGCDTASSDDELTHRCGVCPEEDRSRSGSGFHGIAQVENTGGKSLVAQVAQDGDIIPVAQGYVGDQSLRFISNPPPPRSPCRGLRASGQRG